MCLTSSVATEWNSWRPKLLKCWSVLDFIFWPWIDFNEVWKSWKGFMSSSLCFQNTEIWRYDMRKRENSNWRLFQTSKTWKTEAFFQFTSSFFDLFWFESHNRSYQQRFHLSFMSLESAQSFHLVFNRTLEPNHFYRTREIDTRTFSALLLSLVFF